MVWINAEDGALAVNSAVGRVWPTNLRARSARHAVLVDRGRAIRTTTSRSAAPPPATDEGADEHINALTKKYIDQDEYPFRQPGEERVKFVIEPEHIRHQKQG